MKTKKKSLAKNFIISIVKPSGSILLTCMLLIQFNLLSQKSNSEKTCVECHQRTVKKEILHGPVAADCTSCHIPNGKEHPLEDISGFTYLEEGSNLCFTCHEEEGNTITNNKYVHKPVSRGECTECHEVHSSNNPKLIFAKSPDICYFCHSKLEKAIENLAVVHLPATQEGGCIGCHSPHSSPERKMLVSNPKELCLSCHNKTITKGDRKIANIDQLIRKSKVVHAALDRSCNSCHEPHASENKSLLDVYYPTGVYAKGTEENYELCFGCHDTELLLAETTKIATEFRDGENNLHYVHVNKEKGRTCNTCHNMHGTINEHLIPETVKFGKWDMPLVFKQTENGGSCKGCHAELSYTR